MSDKPTTKTSPRSARKSSAPKKRTAKSAQKKQRGKSKPAKRGTKRADTSAATQSKPRAAPGLAARELALKLTSDVLFKGRSFDEARAEAFATGKNQALSVSDRGLARLIAATVLRRKFVLDTLIDAQLDRPLKTRHRQVRANLLCAAAQLLFLNTPAHAAISLAVDLTRRNRTDSHLTGLVNAVLRKLANLDADELDAANTPQNAIPPWLWTRWEKHFGSKLAKEIAQACLREPPLDITVKADAAAWAKKLNATELETGSLRLAAGGRIEDLEGYGEGEWWIQDAAAALPARLLADINNKTVADLCAAPGGKTAQLAAMGADVTAVDIDAQRLARVTENLTRLKLSAKTVAADILSWQPGQTFDAVLLDAPCTATGTIRRHPDIMHLKREDDISELATRQQTILKQTAKFVRPGGSLVYCTCSLEPEEGEHQIAKFLETHANFELVPITSGECNIRADWITDTGTLRTLPFHTPQGEDANEPPPGDGVPLSGMDGFFAARLQRAS